MNELWKTMGDLARGDFMGIYSMKRRPVRGLEPGKTPEIGLVVTLSGQVDQIGH